MLNEKNLTILIGFSRLIEEISSKMNHNFPLRFNRNRNRTNLPEIVPIYQNRSRNQLFPPGPCSVFPASQIFNIYISTRQLQMETELNSASCQLLVFPPHSTPIQPTQDLICEHPIYETGSFMKIKVISIATPSPQSSSVHPAMTIIDSYIYNIVRRKKSQWPVIDSCHRRNKKSNNNIEIKIRNIIIHGTKVVQQFLILTSQFK